MLQYWAAAASYVHSLLLLWPFMLVPEEKRKRKNKKEAKTTDQPPPSLWTEMPRRPRLLPKGFSQFCEGLCCRPERRAGRQHASTKPAVTLPCAPRTAPAAPPRGRQPGVHSSAAGGIGRVCGKLSTNLPAVLHYLNVSKLPTLNVYKYISLQKIVVYRPTTNIYIYVRVCVYTYKDVCVCVYVQIHMQTQTCIYMFSLNT